RKSGRHAVAITRAPRLRGETTVRCPGRSVSAAAAEKAASMRVIVWTESEKASTVEPAPDRHAPISPAPRAASTRRGSCGKTPARRRARRRRRRPEPAPPRNLAAPPDPPADTLRRRAPAVPEGSLDPEDAAGRAVGREVVLALAHDRQVDLAPTPAADLDLDPV